LGRGGEKLAFEVEPSNRRYRLRLARYRYHAEALGRYLDGAGRVLDAGCGKGRLPLYWRRWAPAGAAPRFLGLDRSPRRLALARGRGYSGLVRGDLSRRLPVADGSLDALVCEQVLEHLSDAEVATVLAEARRVLRAGGVALFGVPIFRPLVRRVLPLVLRLRGWWERGREVHHAHLQHFTLARLRGLVEGQGFEVEEVRGFRVFSLPGNWLEDHAWYYRAQSWLGARFPQLCNEVLLVCRTPRGGSA
jgi:SAM-dependent methyltransferase